MGSLGFGINKRLELIATGKQVTLLAAATLTPDQQNVLLDSTAGAMSITMPRAEDCAGRKYGLTLTVDGGDVTVVFPAAAGQDPADAVLTAVDDYVELYSSGERWMVSSEITT